LTAGAPPWPSRRELLVAWCVLALAVGIVYWRALDAPFVFDDLPGIVDNPSIKRLWPPIGDAAERGPLNPPALSPTSRRPLANLTFALNYAAGGLDPRGYRLVNLVLHVTVALLLATFLRYTLLLPYFAGAFDRTAGPVALAAALLWAVHPLVTDAVAYVTQRTELMAATCYLIALVAALAYRDASSGRARAAWVGIAALASCAGAVSKEWIVSAPLVAALYGITFLGHGRRDLRRAWPLYAALASGWILVAALTIGGVGGLSDVRHRVPVHVWWMTQSWVVFLYLKLAVWPSPLSIHYTPTVLWTVADAWPWLVAVGLLAAGTALLVRGRPAARFAVVAAALIIAPASLVPLPKMVAAERRMYLPLAVLIALVAGAYRTLLARRPHAGRRIAWVAAAAALIAVAGVVSAERLRAYESAVAIWHDAVLHQPDDAMSHYNLGVALVEAGRPPVEAMREFDRALALDPEHTGAIDNIGMLLYRAGNVDEARARFEHALRIDPADAVAHNNLGGILTRTGRPRDAIPHLRLALALQPDAPKAKVHLNLGQALVADGAYEEGLAHLEQAVRSAPDDADARVALGGALVKLGRPDAALAHLERAVAVKPDDVEAHVGFATARLQTGDASGAVESYRRALALDPGSSPARNNLAGALRALGRTDEAIAELEAALRAAPDHAGAHYNLAAALLDVGRVREAITHCEEAVRLDPADAHARFQCATAYARADDDAKARALADAALATARTRGETDLVDAIETWRSSRRAASGR
jgi:tetratricopeptide (TPR) repeat protein